MIVLEPTYSASTTDDSDRFWFGIDFGNSFIKVSCDVANCPCIPMSGEKSIALGNSVQAAIVYMMESKITRFELFGLEENNCNDDEYFDFSIINIKKLLDCLDPSKREQLQEISILESDQIDGEQRLITEISIDQNVTLKSKGDIENLNKLMLIKIIDTKTNYSMEISLFTILLKLFEKLKRGMFEKEMGIFKRNIVTVPIHYNDLQLTILKDAFEMAGFKVERAIRDVVAACLACSIDKNTSERHVLALNCGSTQTTAVLYLVDEGIFELIDYMVDSDISGNSIDEQLVHYCVQEFKKKTKKQLVNEKARIRLLKACKLAKEELYGENNPHNTLIQVDSLMDGVDFSLVLSKPKFEQIISPITTKLTSLLNSLLERNSNPSIGDLVLCGGCCQISKFSSAIRDFFKGNNEFTLHDTIPPKSIKARGASKCCDIFRVVQTCFAPTILPLSIGIEHNKKMMILAQRSTYVPYKKVFTIEKKVDPTTNQFHFVLFMGERSIPRYNFLLREFCIPNNENSRCTREFTMDVSISDDEILTLIITDTTSGEEYQFQTDWVDSNLTVHTVSENVRLGELDNSS